MTGKRFTIGDSNIIDGYCIFDKEKKYHFVPVENKERLMSTVKVLNALADENEQLKSEKEKWKQQCIHFKEMLDDMDIAYLCDEWIFEELKE